MTLTSVKKDAGEVSSETRTHPVLRTTLMICAAFAVIALAVLVLGAMSADDSDAAVGDTFTVNTLLYTVLTDDETSKTVSVASTSDFKPSNYTLTIPSTVQNSDVTYDVVKVADNGFKSNTYVRTANIPASIREIGNSAFSQCPNFYTLSLPNNNNIETLGTQAFYNAKFSSIQLPAIVSIGNSALNGCASLTSVTLGSNLESMGTSVFSGCSKLSSITIPDGITTINSYTFNGCSLLTSVTMGENVSTIGDYAFRACSKLSSIQIPSNVTSIGNYAFQNCTLLTSVTLPAGLESMGAECFSISGLTEITLPSSVTSLGSNMFKNCSNLVTINYYCTDASFSGSSSNNAIGANIVDGRVINIGAGVQKIPNYCFNNVSATYNLADESQLTTIGDYAFYGGAEGVSTVINFDLPENLASIGAFAFAYGDFGDRNVILGQAIQSVGMSAFKDASISTMTIDTGVTLRYLDGNPGLLVYTDNATTIASCAIGIDTTKVVIGSGISQIENGALTRCRTFDGNTAFYHPANVSTLEVDSANFSLSDDGVLYSLAGGVKTKLIAAIGVDGVLQITIPNTVTEIVEYAFLGKTISSQLVLPASIAVIGSNAFEGSIFEGEFVIPSTVSTLETKAFLGATFEDTLTVGCGSIGESAFENASIASLTVDSASVGKKAFNKATIGSLSFSSNAIGFIGTNVFDYATIGGTLTIPSNVTLANYAFSNTHLGDVIVRTASVPDYAFQSATMKSLTADSTLGSIGGYAFQNAIVSENISITSPVSTIGSYAFQNASAAQMAIPPTVRSFGSNAFDGSALSSIVFWEGDGDASVSIGANAFSNTLLTEVVIPARFSSIGANAFYNACDLWYIKFMGLDDIVLTNIGSGAFDTQYSTDASLFSMKVTDADGGITHAAIGDMVTAGKFGGTVVNQPPEDPVYVLETDASGVDDIEWSFNHTTGVLTFSAHDTQTVMKTYSSITEPPWYSIKKFVKAIVIDDSITSVSKFGMSGYPICESITIGTGVTTIGGIEDYPELTSLTIGSNVATVTSIKNLSKVTTLVIGPNVVTMTTISNLPELTTLTIGEKVRTLGTIENLPKLTTMVYKATALTSTYPLFKNIGTDTEGVHVSFVTEEGVSMTLPEGLFSTSRSSTMNLVELDFQVGNNLTLRIKSMECVYGVTKVTFNAKAVYNSNDLSGIDNAGKNASSLEIVIGSNMTAMPPSSCIGAYVTIITFQQTGSFEIPDSAFMNSARLTSITLPSGCTRIGNNAFKNCTRLSTFIINANCTVIGSSAFEGCTALTGIDLSHVATIGNRAFFGCTSFVTDANSPTDLSSATSIGTQAFSGDMATHGPRFHTIVWPSALAYLGSMAFQGTGACIGALTISDTLALETSGTTVGYYFDTCTITALTIDKTGTIPVNAFTGIETGSDPFALSLKKTPDTLSLSSDFKSKINVVNVTSDFVWSGYSGNDPFYTTSGGVFAGCHNLTTLNIAISNLRIGSNAFTNCDSLAAINGFENIKFVGGSSFSGCTSLFTAPWTQLTGLELSTNSFANTGITMLMLTDCTLGVGNNTAMPFAGCAITDVILSGGNVGADISRLMNGTQGAYRFSVSDGRLPVFTGATGMSTLIIGTGVTGSPDEVRFAGCTGLTNILFSSTEFDIDAFKTSQTSPFDGLTQNLTVTLGAGAKVPKYMFKGLNVNNSQTIGSGMNIGMYAFFGTLVPSVTIEDGSTVGSYVFDSCASLMSVTINGEPTLGSYIFRECSHLSMATMTGSPTAIPNGLFSGCISLSGFTIPSSVTEIGTQSFSSCRSISSIILPAGLVSIGVNAFSSCKGLTTIALPSGLETIGDRAFSGCTELTGITIPASVTSIGINAFNGCSKFETLTFESGGTEGLAIGNSAFAGLNITSLALPERTATIAVSAFENTNITELTIPAGVNLIASSAFAGTSHLTHVTILGNVASANNAFNGAGSDSGYVLTISNGVTSIPALMFRNSKVSSIETGSGQISVGSSAFAGSLKITSVPSAFTAIGDSAFEGCTGITELSLDGVSVGLHAFDGCTNLTTIRTTGTTSLGNYAFSNCPGLTLVVFSDSTTFGGTNTFKYGEGSDSSNAWTFLDTTGIVIPGERYNVTDTGLKGKAFKWTGVVDEYKLKQCYKVTFDVGGLADEIPAIQVTSSDNKIDAPSLTGVHTGYLFSGGWYLGGESTPWDFENRAVESDMTLVARITPKTYDINIDGGVAGTTTLHVTYDSKNVTLDPISRTGYHITLITTDSAGEIPIIASLIGIYTLGPNVGDYTDSQGRWVYDMGSTEELTFYIVWEGDYCQVDLLKGDSPALSGDGYIGITYGGGMNLLSYTAPSNTGYSPKGYYTTASHEVKVIGINDHGEPVLIPNVPDYTDSQGNWIGLTVTELYADWEPMKVYLVLGVNETEPDEGDGFAVATRDQSDLSNYSDAVKTGYALLGYYTETGVTPLIGADGKLVESYYDTVLGDMTDDDGKWVYIDVAAIRLIARWEPITYTIAFDANGGTGEMESHELTYDAEPWKLTPVTFTKVGYEFAGWNTRADGEGDSYYDKELVSNLADTQGATVTLYAQWEPITYTVIFNGNGSTSGTMASQTLTYDKAENLTANAFARTGYTFAGWKLTAEAAAAVYQDGASVINLADTQDEEFTLYAHWTANEYTITLDNSGGSGLASTTADFDGDLSVYPTATKPGYDFVGYFDGNLMVIGDNGMLVSNAAPYTDADGKWIFADDVTFTAKWDETTYALQLDNAGGTGGTSVNVKYHGNLKPNPMTLPTRNGYDFAGYFAGDVKVIDKDGYLVRNNAPYTDADGKWQIIVEETITLTAHWGAKTYEIIIVSGEGEENDGTATVVFGAAGLTVTKVPTRTGYSVDGYLIGSLTGQTIADVDGSFGGRTIADWTNLGKWCRYEGDMSIYAGWIPIQYTVTLDPNGGTATVGTYTIYFDQSTTDAGRPAKPTREGYDFAGYYTAATDGARVFDINCNGIVGVAEWTDGAGCWINAGENQKLYAHWTPKTIYVSLADSDTGVANGYLSINFDATEVLSMHLEHGRAGYVTGAFFAELGCATRVITKERHTVPDVQGWTNGSGEWKVDSDEAVLYIQWELVTTPIVLDANNGDTNGSATATYSMNVLTGYVPAAKTGHSLTGYYTSRSTQTQETMVIDADGNIVPNTVYADADGKWTDTYGYTVTLYAGWQINQYTITFMDGDQEMAELTGYYGFAVEGVPSNPTKDGYTFLGWDKTIPTTYPAEDMTINAQWEIVTYTVTYNLDGGVNSPSNPASFTVESAAIVFQDPTKEGYSFRGWFAEGAFVNPVTGISAGSHADVEVFAKWEINQYTITFDSAGGSGVDPITDDYGAAVAAPADPTRNGYAFVGWQPALPATMPAQNMTVTAVWSVLPTPSTDQAIDFNVPGAETVVIDTTVGAIADALNDAAKTEVKVEGDGWNMILPKEIVKGATGVVSMGAKTLSATDIDALPQTIKEKVSGKAVFSLSLTDSNGKVTFAGKNVTVTLPYVLKSGESASDVKLFYIDDSNVIHEVVATYDEASKTVTFSTDHFSYWYIDATSSGSSSSGGGSSIGLIIGIVVAVIAVAAIVGVVVVKKKKA